MSSALEMPKVTIITPTYNRAMLLPETIDSVLGQNYANIEYIVVNDGSTDGTSEVLDRYEGKIKVINKKNSGQVDSLTAGWSVATGKYLSYISDDDILLPDAIKSAVRELENNKSLICVYPNCHLIDPAGNIIKKNVSKPTIYYDLVVKQHCYIGPGAVFSAKAYRSVGPWNRDYKIAPDREFWMRLGRLGEFKLLDNVLALYRTHEDSISFKCIKKEEILEYIKVLDNFFKTDTFFKKEDQSVAYANALLLVASSCWAEFDVYGGLIFILKAFKKNYKACSPKALWVVFRSAYGRKLRAMIWRLRGKRLG